MAFLLWPQSFRHVLIWNLLWQGYFWGCCLMLYFVITQTVGVMNKEPIKLSPVMMSQGSVTVSPMSWEHDATPVRWYLWLFLQTPSARIRLLPMIFALVNIRLPIHGQLYRYNVHEQGIDLTFLSIYMYIEKGYFRFYLCFH